MEKELEMEKGGEASSHFTIVYCNKHVNASKTLCLIA